MEARLLPSYRDWETGTLSSSVGWNKQNILLSFPRQGLQGAGVVILRDMALSC